MTSLPRCVRRHRGAPVRIYLSAHEQVGVQQSIWLSGPANHTRSWSAVDAWDRMHHYGSFGRHDWARIRILRPGTDTISERDPLAQAVRYPEIVIIAGVLASPE